MIDLETYQDKYGLKCGSKLNNDDRRAISQFSNVRKEYHDKDLVLYIIRRVEVFIEGNNSEYTYILANELNLKDGLNELKRVLALIVFGQEGGQVIKLIANFEDGYDMFTAEVNEETFDQLIQNVNYLCKFWLLLGNTSHALLPKL